ncbi:DUF4168 domain-containing protein [Halopseudomonas salegens]|uniref:DUF4168 domain-containing protein n=1 Tax=Halopseudomonas salegens TaxID=1434072 RepID=A0A1H2GAF2_9GAMM|nr:DUF4168 domain-containing protein [Halopseudomonas salegens]SDU16461.1 protein of unknown function [Halopseudomonas salegens]
MMNLKTLTAAVALATFGMASTAAMAQASDPAQQPPSGMPAQQAAAEPVSDEDLQNFVDAASEVNEIRDEFTGRLEGVESQEEAQALQIEAQEKMVEAVEDSGIEVNQYNEIATRLQADPELQERAEAMN